MRRILIFTRPLLWNQRHTINFVNRRKINLYVPNLDPHVGPLCAQDRQCARNAVHSEWHHPNLSESGIERDTTTTYLACIRTRGGVCLLLWCAVMDRHPVHSRTHTLEQN